MPPSAIALREHGGGGGVAAVLGLCMQPPHIAALPPPGLSATQKIQVETNDKTFSLALPLFYRVV